MGSAPSSLNFAVIGHQDNWNKITSFINGVRTADREQLDEGKVKSIFPFIPPRDLFRVTVQSKTGTAINGVYIDTFIDPDKLDTFFARTNISKVMHAVSHAKKMGAKIVTLGGFTSIVLEGRLDACSAAETKFTTGNTLTAAFILKGIEKAAVEQQIDLPGAAVLIIGATGDIGMACVNYLKGKVKKLLLCARNNQRLQHLYQSLVHENIPACCSVNLEDLITGADIVIAVASSSGISMKNCKQHALICDAGYPKNLETKADPANSARLFHGGMGQVSGGYSFSPDYSKNIYDYPSPYIMHGCILEAMVLAFENKIESYSSGKGNITIDSIEAIYAMAMKHGITVAPFYNSKGLWEPI
jgi:predicted amino acid dehydrogenase